MDNGKAQMTELELTKLENFALKDAGLRQALQANLTARTQYIQQMETAHPGYQWNEQSGTLIPTAPQEPLPDPAQA